ncbi:hypothetical protein BKA82DRAFT_4199709 [Pisolithus tinctorius]|nr:hypothetical protein BKA82DRAFT_4199709 [Pisolithus tinctorius]
MHPCLRVYEILQLIFRCVEDRSTLCALARTCRTFNEPATALIWETLTAMEPILGQLSSARIVRISRYVHYWRHRYLVRLSRPLTDNDWNIVRRLSSRVRRFHVSFIPVLREDYRNDHIPEGFDFLASPPDPSFLFPNLRALSFEAPDDISSNKHKNAVIQFFHLLLRPHLSALRLKIPDLLSTRLDISAIPTLCPNIRILNIKGLSHYSDGVSTQDLDQLSRIVSKLRHLEAVKSYVSSWEMLSGLAQMKGLRRLSVSLPRILGLRPECPSGEIFPQLRTLNVIAASVASCTDFFRWTSLDKVTEICINCSDVLPDNDPSQNLVEMTSLISLQCKHLEILWISSSSSRDDEIPTAWPRPLLENYQAFHQLRAIALKTPISFTLSDSDLEGMVKAWPHLEAFHLFHQVMLDPPVQLTLRGVTALLYHCPKLKHFTLTFDATHVPAPLSYSTLVRNTAVGYMGVCASPVSESRDVAAYLSTIMPYLTVIGVVGASYRSAWLWICTQHQHKPAIRVDMSPTILYHLLTTGTERGGDPVKGRSGEWCWTSPRDWYRVREVMKRRLLGN